MACLSVESSTNKERELYENFRKLSPAGVTFIVYLMKDLLDGSDKYMNISEEEFLKEYHEWKASQMVNEIIAKVRKFDNEGLKQLGIFLDLIKLDSEFVHSNYETIKYMTLDELTNLLTELTTKFQNER